MTRIYHTGLTVFSEQFRKLAGRVDVAENARRVHRNFDHAAGIASDNLVEPFIRQEPQNLFEQLRRKQDRVTAAAIVYGKHDAAGLKICQERVNGYGFNQRVIHQKKHSARDAGRQGSQTRLYRRAHSLLVVRIERDGGQSERRLDDIAVISHDDNGAVDARFTDRVEDMLEKRPPAKTEQRLGLAHALGFACGENDGGDQCVSA